MRKYCWKMLLSTILIVLLTEPVGAGTLSHGRLESLASSYLELLDQRHYEDAWLAMSPFFQALNDQAQWQSRQQVIRSAYGSLVSRQLFRISYRKSYSLSPDSRYMLVQYKSIFQDKAVTNETVVLDCRKALSCSVREYIMR